MPHTGSKTPIASAIFVIQSSLLSDVARLPARERVPLRSPFGAQVFAHVQRAGERISIELPDEPIGKGGAVYFTDIARKLNLIARDGAREIAGYKLSLVGSHQLAALLLQVMWAPAARELADDNARLRALTEVEQPAGVGLACQRLPAGRITM